MNRYGADEIRVFLRAVDAALEKATKVVVIGGSAAALAVGVTRRTQDIDTWTRVDSELGRAVEIARAQTGLAIPFAQSGVADGPYDFEARLVPVLPELVRLAVFVPEKHDLVLMKLLRGYEHDLETIDEIHHRSPVDLEVLVERYEQEMGAVVMEPARMRLNFLVMVERVFPERLTEVERRIGKPR